MSNRHLVEKLFESIPRLKAEVKVKEKILDKQIQRYTNHQNYMSLGIVLGLIAIFLAFTEGIISGGLIDFLVLVLVLFIIYAFLKTLKDKDYNRRLLKEIKKQKEEIKALENKKNRISSGKAQAKVREMARDYDSAIEIWESLGEISEAARVRKLKTEQGSVKVAQSVVQGDQVTNTEIKDSVLNRSNVGEGSSKMQELQKLTEMKEKGLIDDDEFKQMKKEILGK